MEQETARPCYRSMWVDRWQQNVASNDYELILSWDVFRDWRGNMKPQSIAVDELRTALSILYAHQSPNLAARFLDRAQQVIDRIHTENTLDQPQCRKLPVKSQYAQFYRIEAFVRAFRARGALDKNLLRQSAEYYKADGAELDKQDWHEMTQYDYLTGVHMYLLVDDVEKAADMLTLKRSFRKQTRHFSLMQALVALRQGKTDPDSVLPEFDAVFDIVRAPPWYYKERQVEFYFPNDIAGFEWSLMREVLFLAKGAAPNWDRVVEMAGT